jgi:hypothetical protein
MKNTVNKTENKHIYKIMDIDNGLRKAFANIVGIYLFGGMVLGCQIWFSVFYNLVDYDTITNTITFLKILFPFVLVQSILMYEANKSYVIDLFEDTFTFPKSDMENSIFEVLIMAPYWNSMFRRTIYGQEIENMYIDTKRIKRKNSETKTLYTLNIVGTFGSSNLEFSNRQKRDEVRNAINSLYRKVNGRSIDRKVSEFI